MKKLLALLALLCAGPAATQTISGCSSVASNRVATSKDAAKLRADADCFGRAATLATASAKVRTERIAALTPQPVPTPVPTPTPKPTPVVEVPIASNFDRSAFIVPGYDHGGSSVPPSGKPDVVGAFRFVCFSGPVNWDDAIIYPGQRGGSPHPHQNFGNTSIRYDSTYASLRGAGESTCNNPLNRSAYWMPTMQNAAGKVIRPYIISIYYKRRPITDPGCFVQAAKGCVALPFNFRAVAGFDMKRHGQAQPENQVFYHRCISAGKKNDPHPTLTEALADCGGSGEIASSIGFGDCWNGQLNSPDHRSHIAHGSYGDWGYLRCPATHPYVIPQLTQTALYTIEPGDGEVYFSSDRMAGIPAMAPGSTFHADYMAAWDPDAQATWERDCLNALRSCIDGELGDGTMLKRVWTNTLPRLADLPARPAG